MPGALLCPTEPPVRRFRTFTHRHTVRAESRFFATLRPQQAVVRAASPPVLVLALPPGCVGRGPPSKCRILRPPAEHQRAQNAIFAPRRKYRDFAAVVWHRACRTAARRAARADSGVRRARPDVGTTHPAPARRARSAAKRVIPPCGGEVVGWGRKVNVQDGEGNRSGLLVRGEGSMA